ncbi:unnamed protein product [Blepharisma stoltei]|uniref:Aquaporin n=1 Tax=Blepharisma stoltei TaxID=1481888 RepID=A0AAU9J932_9CILI|nr:unnamed protein product [Blepharisma stoltei]
MAWREYFAELHGTAMLAFIVFASDGGPFSVGLGLWGIINVTGCISGAHFNPAVTLGVILNKKINKSLTSSEFIKFLIYMIIQLGGAFIGSLFAELVTDSHFGFKNRPGHTYRDVFVGETIATGHIVMAALMIGHLTTYSLMATLVLCFTVVAHIFTIGPISGACFNPAVGIAVSVVKTVHFNDSSYIDHLWIYIVAPFLGVFYGIIPALIYSSDEKFKGKSVKDTQMSENLIFKEDS